MNKIQKEMLKELEDVVKYYSKDTNRRGLNKEGDCMFLTPEGNRCAIGRKLNKKDLEMLAEEGLLDGGIPTLTMGDFELSTKIIKRLPINFWQDLQILHDTDSNWKTDSGMTVKGKRIVQTIKNRISSGKYDKKDAEYVQ